MRILARPAITAACLAVATGCSNSGDVAEPQPPAATTVADGVEYRTQTLVLESFPVQLHTIVDVTNRSSDRVELVFPDGCVVLLRAFQDPQQEPVWDQGRDIACTMMLTQADLAPGESRRFETRTGARDILGDSLNDGRYRLEAYLRPSGKTVRIDAGTVHLAVPR